MLAIGLLGGRGLSLGGGVLYSSMDLKIVLLSAAGCYAVITLMLAGGGPPHRCLRGSCSPPVLTLRERQAELTALVDTGNTLTDPVSGRPVMVAEGETLSGLCSHRVTGPGPEDLRGPGGGAGAAGGGPPAGGACRLLPYRAVGVDRGLLLAVRVDRVQGGRGGARAACWWPCLPHRLSDGGGYSALIGALTWKGEDCM